MNDAVSFAAGYPKWRRCFAYLVYPAVFLGALLGAHGAMARGTSPPLALATATVVAALCVMVSEWIQPHAARWSRSHGDIPTDAAHVLLSQLLPPPLVDALIRVPLMAAAAWSAGAIGTELWPSNAPMLLQLLLAMVISELGQYGWHRLCHERDWFWRFHATHHSAPRLYWLNAGRFHPLDTVISYTLQATPLLLMGASEPVIVLFSLWTSVHGMFQHSNIELRLGPLNWVFSMAELHRWHHSRDPRDQNTNYGANIIFWDLVFGTYHFPKDRRPDPADVGFEGDERFPRHYLGQLASLFRWDRIYS